MVLEKVYNNATMFAKNYNFESVRSSLYNYIASIAYNTLHKSIYEPYIKNNIATFATSSPVT
jgi:hypothetical protein